MRTEELIAKLSSEARPVRPPPSPLLVASWWALLSAAGVAVAVAALAAVRPDWRSAVGFPPAIAAILSAGLLGWLAARRAILLALPGRAVASPSRAAILLFVVYVAALLLHRLRGGEVLDGLARHGFLCTLSLLAFAALPGLVLALALRRFAPTDPAAAARAGGLAAAALGALGIGLCCANTNFAHLVVYHGLPLVAAAVLAGLGARWWLRW